MIQNKKQSTLGTRERRNEYMKKLKPCPFCGKKVDVKHLGDCFYVRCDWCYIETSTHKIEQEAIRDWNRRTKNNG